MSSLVEVFEDTLFQCRNDKTLSDSIEKSLAEQRIILEGESLECTLDLTSLGRVLVTKNRTMQAAQGYPDKKVCVLNFASACNPGGGVIKGRQPRKSACAVSVHCIHV